MADFKGFLEGVLQGQLGSVQRRRDFELEEAKRKREIEEFDRQFNLETKRRKTEDERNFEQQKELGAISEEMQIGREEREMKRRMEMEMAETGSFANALSFAVNRLTDEGAKELYSNFVTGSGGTMPPEGMSNPKATLLQFINGARSVSGGKEFLRMMGGFVSEADRKSEEKQNMKYNLTVDAFKLPPEAQKEMLARIEKAKNENDFAGIKGDTSEQLEEESDKRKLGIFRSKADITNEMLLDRLKFKTFLDARMKDAKEAYEKKVKPEMDALDSEEKAKLENLKSDEKVLEKDMTGSATPEGLQKLEDIKNQRNAITAEYNEKRKALAFPFDSEKIAEDFFKEQSQPVAPPIERTPAVTAMPVEIKSPDEVEAYNSMIELKGNKEFQQRIYDEAAKLTSVSKEALERLKAEIGK